MLVLCADIDVAAAAEKELESTVVEDGYAYAVLLAARAAVLIFE